MQTISLTQLNTLWQTQAIRIREEYFAGRTEAAEKVAVFCAVFLPWVLVGVLFIYTLVERMLPVFFYAVLAGLTARGINELVHLGYKSPRPPVADPKIRPLIPLPENWSFPSGHCSFFFAVSFFLFFFSNVMGIEFLLLTTLIGAARVFCNVHRWQDILGSFFVGLVSAMVIFLII
jgi:undecaprenyl-diphosphatase